MTFVKSEVKRISIPGLYMYNNYLLYVSVVLLILIKKRFRVCTSLRSVIIIITV